MLAPAKASAVVDTPNPDDASVENQSKPLFVIAGIAGGTAMVAIVTAFVIRFRRGLRVKNQQKVREAMKLGAEPERAFTPQKLRMGVMSHANSVQRFGGDLSESVDISHPGMVAESVRPTVSLPASPGASIRVAPGRSPSKVSITPPMQAADPELYPPEGPSPAFAASRSKPGRLEPLYSTAGPRKAIKRAPSSVN